jgi:hypothetical protein
MASQGASIHQDACGGGAASMDVITGVDPLLLVGHPG